MDLGKFPLGRTCSHHARNTCPSIFYKPRVSWDEVGPVSVLVMERCSKKCDVSVLCVFVRVGDVVCCHCCRPSVTGPKKNTICNRT